MKAWILSCCVAACALPAAGQGGSPPAPPPQQPIPFSHKLHAGQYELTCALCHPNPEPGEKMSIAGPGTCMECHSTIRAESEAIRKLASLASGGREVRWARVYQIPTYVFFSHKAHRESGSLCADCHGAVQERDQLSLETDISMGGCMSCHRAKNASNDCKYCHDEL